jgi:hypothetical protein
MCLIGALFGLSRLRRRTAPSTSAGAAPPRA